MAADNQNLLNILNQDSAARMVEKYMRKQLLERPMREGVLAKSAYGMSLGIPTRSGQYMRLTQTKGLRRPQTMLSPGGGGSDPLSPAKTGINDLDVPLEWIHEYTEIAKVASETSWLDFKNILKGGMSESLHLRVHELTQNAMFVGRYQPGQYAADGSIATAFDTTVEKTVTLYGNSFTFKQAPKYYAGLAADFAALVAAGTRTRYSDLDAIATRLKISGAPRINGKYVCVLSQSMMNDMLTDPDLDPRIAAAITASSAKARKGMEDGWLGEWGQLMFMEDDYPYTVETSGVETTRAEWGDVHGAMIFGAGAWGKLKLGSQDVATMPNPKIQDITKTGYSLSIGYLVPGQVAVINPNWCATYKAVVSTSKPNNYNAVDNKQLAFGGETLG